jgi:hypothetical protein
MFLIITLKSSFERTPKWQFYRVLTEAERGYSLSKANSPKAAPSVSYTSSYSEKKPSASIVLVTATLPDKMI